MTIDPPSALGSATPTAPPLTGPAETSAATPPGPPTQAPADAPLVSVLVRSMGRPTLADALASVAAQTYPAVEVVVVNASGTPHPPLPPCCGDFPLRLVEPGVPLARAAAANAALAAARGAWLLFLDDDDLLDADHLARLRAALAAQPLARVAYTGVRLLAADGSAAGTLDEPFDAGRLWLANYLPIHAVMFSRALLDEGHRFDETMPVYEDWDFWHRLARVHRFVHVSGASASYRLLGSSGLSSDADEQLAREHRRSFYRKWLPRLTGDEIERVAAAAELARGQARDARAAAGGLRRALAEAETRAQALDARLDESRAAHETLARLMLQEQHQRTLEQQTAAEREHQLAQLRRDLDAADAAYRELEQGYRAVTSSRSWRLTQHLRTLRRDLPDAARRLARWSARLLPPAQRQRRKGWLARRHWGRALLRRVAPGSVGAAPPAAAPALDKEAVRRQAEADLGLFLAGSGRLQMPVPDAGAPPRVSVVVVLYNQAGLSRLCLQALAASAGVPFELIVVDNGSTDRVPELLARVDGATVLRPGSNLGFVRAVNLAAGHAQGEFLLLLNNDALVEPATLRHAVARLDADATVAAVGGPILWWDGRLQEAGSIVWRDGSCQGYGRGDDPLRPEYRYLRDVDYCSGALLMVRRPWFERLGRFDEAYAPAYYEESDLCARLWEVGQRVVYDPAVRVRHFEFASEGAPGAALELQQRNRALFVERHRDFLAARPEPGEAALLHARQRLAPAAMRVLVIDDRVPLPWLGQGYPRAASLVAELVAQGHFVTHYPLQFPHEDAADLARALPATVETMVDHGLAGFDDFLRRRAGYYELVIVSRPHNMAALRQARQRVPGALAGARLVYDAEALFSLREIARSEVEGRPLPAAERQHRIATELALADGADAIVAVSEAEAAHYRAVGHAQVHVLGHTLAAERGTPGFEPRQGLLFVGAITDDDSPNADSLVWFVREVWPQVVDALGAAAVLEVVGPCTSRRVAALASPTVRLVGPADDLAPHFDAARVFVVPTRYAAGIPHKAHEAAARGLPMVATPLIARQLGWEGRLAVGADAAAFAEHCVALHRDAARWQAMRDVLLDAVTADCSPARFAEGVRQLLGPRDGECSRPRR